MSDKKIDENKIERKLSKEDLERFEILQKSEEIKGNNSPLTLIQRL